MSKQSGLNKKCKIEIIYLNEQQKFDSRIIIISKD